MEYFRTYPPGEGEVPKTSPTRRETISPNTQESPAMSDQPKTESTLANLRAYTPARIALARGRRLGRVMSVGAASTLPIVSRPLYT